MTMKRKPERRGRPRLSLAELRRRAAGPCPSWRTDRRGYERYRAARRVLDRVAQAMRGYA